MVGFLVLGLIAGVAGKALLHKRAGGWIATLFLAVIGAIVAGFLGALILRSDLGSFLDPRTGVLALAGSVAVLIAFGALTGRRG